MTETGADIIGWLNEIAAAWEDLHAAYAGLDDEQFLEPGATGDWSTRDILAHIAVWDGEARNALPAIAAGRREEADDEREGLDAFNARKTEELRGMPLDDVRELLDDSHRQLLDYLQGLAPHGIDPENEGAFRERLAGDTWDHYPEHAASIRAFREAREW
jgi:hypothetical protein